VTRVRPDVHERFVAILQRGIAKADQAHAEHLARLRPTREDRRGRGRQRIRELLRPVRRRP